MSSMLTPLPARKPLTLVCQVRLAPFDLDAALIDRDRGLDVATFAVSENEVRTIDAVPIDCRGNWPPPEPDRMRAASLAGFPEIMRIVRPNRSVEFNAYGALPAVEDVTDSQIIFTYDPERNAALHAPKPPLGFNLSGRSGGPVLMHGDAKWPSSLVSRGPDHSWAERCGRRRNRVVRHHPSAPHSLPETRRHILEKPSAGGWLP
jgi:hypothetical protein